MSDVNIKPVDVAVGVQGVVQGLLIGVGSSVTFGPLIADISHWFDRRRGIGAAATRAQPGCVRADT